MSNIEPWNDPKYWSFLRDRLNNGYYTDFYNQTSEEIDNLRENIQNPNIDGIPEGLAMQSILDFEACKQCNKGAGLNKNVQSVLFDKHIWTLSKATNWLLKNGYKIKFGNKKPHITKSFIRFRQLTPKKNARYRLKNIGHGIEFILEY